MVRYWNATQSDDAGGMYPVLALGSGIRLQVRAVDAEAAVVLLHAKASPTEILELETKAVDAPIKEKVPKAKFAPIQMLIGVGMGIMLCLFFNGPKNSERKPTIITPPMAVLTKLGFITTDI